MKAREIANDLHSHFTGAQALHAIAAQLLTGFEDHQAIARVERWLTLFATELSREHCFIALLETEAGVGRALCAGKKNGGAKLNHSFQELPGVNHRTNLDLSGPLRRTDFARTRKRHMRHA